MKLITEKQQSDSISAKKLKNEEKGDY